MRKAFHEELADVEAVCVQASVLVLEQLDRAMRALVTFDEDLADLVITADDRIDAAYIDVRSRILTLLATQAPVARDLRLVSALLHINIHLERMGDICTTIAKVAKLVAALPRSESLLRRLEEMGTQAAEMVDSSIKSFTNRDLELASTLPDLDEVIDRLNRGLIKEVVSLGGSDEDSLEWAARMILVSRLIERFGDHAVDIAEEAAFLITGEFREFTDASHKAELS